VAFSKLAPLRRGRHEAAPDGVLCQDILKSRHVQRSRCTVRHTTHANIGPRQILLSLFDTANALPFDKTRLCRLEAIVLIAVPFCVVSPLKYSLRLYLFREWCILSSCVKRGLDSRVLQLPWVSKLASSLNHLNCYAHFSPHRQLTCIINLPIGTWNNVALINYRMLCRREIT